MGLKATTIDAMTQKMAATRKGFKAASREDGHFYFVSDPKGKQGALIVHGVAADPEGKKTARLGRSLLQDARKNGERLKYSQGTVSAGSPLVFSITAGNARPTTIKAAFKGSQTLHDGVGSAAASLLKSARIKATGQEDAPASSDAELDGWRRQNAALIAEMGGLTDAEVAELVQAEQGFTALAEALPRSLDEEARLEEQRAETEAAFTELQSTRDRLDELEPGDTEGRRALEAELDAQRQALAVKQSSGADPFLGDTLAPLEQELFFASVTAGMKLLRARSEAALRDSRGLDPQAPDSPLREELRAEVEAISSLLLQLRDPDLP